MNFATLQGLTIPEGVVTQITDASGRVIWAVSGGKVILEVEKITSNTYAGETTYENEEFILLDIYPKTNGTVKVTYGGLTKTITDTSGAEEPNAQQVVFGTFNGVTHDTTPTSGELTIEGDYDYFTEGQYEAAKLGLNSCGCIVNIVRWGSLKELKNIFSPNVNGYNEKLTSIVIPNGVISIDDTFTRCRVLKNITIPKSVTFIGGYSFSGSTALTSIVIDNNNLYYMAENAIIFSKDKTKLVAHPTAKGHCTIPNHVTVIGGHAFGHVVSAKSNTDLTSVTIPNSVIRIEKFAFNHTNNLTDITIPESVTFIGDYAFGRSNSGILTVTMLPKTPPTTDGNPLGDSSPKSIIVPKGCGEAYKAAEGWSEYANKIVEAS